ncbi:MAG TPA: ATP-binding protein [Candidatus Nanoarchaeia archaeon]|nr:ATP-binding protein [Candidatus Nanoarchaeia archaeon]
MVDFKSIIKEQREELEKIEREENIIPREKLEEARNILKYPNILAVLGIRRCGKSIFSYLLAKGSKTGYINFDDERLIELKSEDLDQILTSFYELYGDLDYVILDEVQNVKNWELFVNRLRRTKKVILTGSNSKLLAGELSTHLTGRYLDLELFPFSFREYLLKQGFKSSTAYTSREKAEILNHLKEYLQMGGFPEAYKFGKAIIPRIYNDILTKDILLKHKIKKIEELKKLANYLITNSSQEATYSKLSRILGIRSIITISNWISYLENSFLVFKLERFDFKLKQQFIAPKKFYCIDTGLLNSIGFLFSDNMGRLIENEVAIELQRRKEKTPSKVYYWKDHQQNEADFVIKEDKTITEIIQVTYASGKNDIREREISSLLKASKALRCKNLTVITWDYEAEENKIKFIPLWKWLLRVA